MIDLFDNLMRQILMNQIPGLTEAQVRFQPPDQDSARAVAMRSVLLRNSRAKAPKSKLDHW